jgi:flagellar L-ring protein precursor FlgH
MRIAFLLVCVAISGLYGAKKPKAPPKPTLDDYIQRAELRAVGSGERAPGSLFVPGARLSTFGQDIRASQVDDVVTITVTESLSAAATGTTKTARTAAADSSVTALLGAIPATRALPNLTKLSSATTLDGQGTTTRVTTLNTTLTAHVTHVLPNGNLVVQANKVVEVNSETQVITLRGIVRPADLATDNSIPSDRVAEMEIRVDGKGVVNDAARRPFFLYRLLLGLLPF